MKNIRVFITTLVIWLIASPIFAQSLTITRAFQAIPNSSVLAQYKNQFGKWEKPDLDDTFPYAVIRVGLDGGAVDVQEAKKKLNLYLGQMTAVEAVYKDITNELLFLVPSRARTIYMECGDGCSRQLLIDGTIPLRSNTVYYGRVHFVPVEGTEVVEVVDKEQLKQELFAEFASMLQNQQLNQPAEPTVDTQAEESIQPSLPTPSVSLDTLTHDVVSQLDKKNKTLIMGQVGYSVAPQLSYGAMVGQMYNGYGWYVSGRSNFQFGTTATASCDANGLVDGIKPFYSGNTYTSHMAIHAGFIMNILEKVAKKNGNTLGFYIGGGYGKRELLAETIGGEWIKYAPTSHNGFAGNVGLMGSVAGVTLNVGVSTINFKYMDLEVGIGYMF